jgi:hypothetical protein
VPTAGASLFGNRHTLDFFANALFPSVLAGAPPIPDTEVKLWLKGLIGLETQALNFRYLHCSQPLRKMIQSPKLAILQSLDGMDQVQMEEVLKYIKSVLNQPQRTSSYQSFKREAMKEIRQALRKPNGSMPQAA